MVVFFISLENKRKTIFYLEINSEIVRIGALVVFLCSLLAFCLFFFLPLLRATFFPSPFRLYDFVSSTFFIRLCWQSIVKYVFFLHTFQHHFAVSIGFSELRRTGLSLVFCMYVANKFLNYLFLKEAMLEVFSFVAYS